MCNDCGRFCYLVCCLQALGRQAELRSLYDLAVVERQLLQFQDRVEYRPQWDAKELHMGLPSLELLLLSKHVMDALLCMACQSICMTAAPQLGMLGKLSSTHLAGPGT